MQASAALPLPRSILPRARLSATGALLALAILGFLLILRFGQFGNPIAGLDEQFYLLVGDRMWQGALPYTDIWDRKPAGLFLLYAAIRALPGDGVVAYQIVASACLALTGIVVARITMQVLPALAGLAAGMAVVLYGVLLGTGFGEAPIFYDLLTVVAGGCVLAARERPRDFTALDPRVLAAMALCGLALTLKTSAIFECCAFGLLLVHDDWRRTRDWRATMIRASTYVAIGVAPTAAWLAFYASHGALDAYIFANFASAFLRSGGTEIDSVARFVGFLLLLTPLILPALAEGRHIPVERRIVLTAWAIAGLLSFVAIGRCYEHYILPLVTPLALLAAYGLRRRGVAIGACVVLTLIAAQFGASAAPRASRDEADVAALRALVPSDVRTGCLFVYEGPVILYQQTEACLPGRYVFPGHFTEPAEAAALERPSETILRETLARRPAVIVMAPYAREGGPLTTNDRIVRAALREFYNPIGHQTIRLYGTRRIVVLVWQRR